MAYCPTQQGEAWHGEMEHLCQPASAMGPVPSGQQVLLAKATGRGASEITRTALPCVICYLSLLSAQLVMSHTTVPHSLSAERHPCPEQMQSLSRGQPSLRYPRDAEGCCAGGRLRALGAPLGGQSSSLLRGPGRVPPACGFHPAADRQEWTADGGQTGTQALGTAAWTVSPAPEIPGVNSAPTPPSLLGWSQGARQAKGTEGRRPVSFWLPQGSARRLPCGSTALAGGSAGSGCPARAPAGGGPARSFSKPAPGPHRSRVAPGFSCTITNTSLESARHLAGLRVRPGPPLRHFCLDLLYSR